MIGQLNLDTIVAIATPPGIGALGIIRLSGPDSIGIADKLFAGKNLTTVKSHTLHVGWLVEKNNPIDEVVISIFKNPKSYTGEDVVEISCHGSTYIQQQILQACIAQGARLAKPGEFTQRAFLNGKLDLTQAEAVADMISVETAAQHLTALHNLRGGFSNDLNQLREKLIHFAALIELELDFSEEDVEFADRTQLHLLLDEAIQQVSQLVQSFALGNAIKKGISVAIIGAPNAGKSTLLNALLNEERAIVSPIAGTTRDTIEETITISDIQFRFIDTAGIRQSQGDTIEDIGIERAIKNAENAQVIIHLIDMTSEKSKPTDTTFDWLKNYHNKIIEVHNKYDLWSLQNKNVAIAGNLATGIFITAKNNEGIEDLKNALVLKIGANNTNYTNTVITNTRHHTELQAILHSLKLVKQNMLDNLSSDLLALDLRQCLHHIGTLTGAVQHDRDILGTIFGKFCIGK